MTENLHQIFLKETRSPATDTGIRPVSVFDLREMCNVQLNSFKPRVNSEATVLGGTMTDLIFFMQCFPCITIIQTGGLGSLYSDRWYTSSARATMDGHICHLHPFSVH